MKKRIIITSISLLIPFLFSVLVYAYNTPENKLKRQLTLGDKYLNEQNYEEAILNYIKAIEIERKNIEARFNLAKAYISTQNLDKAEKVLLEVLEIDPENIAARQYIIQMYLSQNKIDEAEKMLKQIFEIDPNKDEQEIIKAINLAKELELSKQNYNTGINLIQDKKYIEAIDSFKKVIEADKERYPDSQSKITECKNSYINENLQKAKNEAQNKNYKAAISYIDLVFKIDSSNSEANKLKREYTESLKTQQEEEQRRKEEEQKKQQTNNLITEDQAMDIALKYAKKSYSKFSFMSEGLENRSGKNYYVIRIFENHSDHIVTLAYYYIEQKGGKAFEYNIVENKILPL